ncbi:hydrogenase maturation protease [Streptomyces sp. NPDC091292]|uniref:hydrogenase maturation protease n=1 Tax=Streptomyces sp. NPDC091292 TaxID=3365991 RepID=UPI00380858FB
MTTPDEPRRVLVAGVGNVFLQDDGFGVETIRHLARLDASRLPPGVELMDAGIRGVHLAYRLLDGYETLVLVDIVNRGGPPGTLYTIDVGPERPGARPAEDPEEQGAGPLETGPLDTHAMDPASVLGLLHDLHAGAGGSLPDEVYVVGCEPRATDEGMGLTPPVAQAVETAADLVLDLVRQGSSVPRRS